MYKISLLLIAALLFMQCESQFQPKDINPGIDKQKEMAYNDLKNRGDREFNKMHWVGWEKAIKFYREALKLHPGSTEIKEKLFFSLILKAIREKQLLLEDPTAIEDACCLLQDINSLSADFKMYFSIARRFMGIKSIDRISIAELEQLKGTIQEDYQFYLYLLQLGNAAPFEKWVAEYQDFLKEYPRSNLKYFLRGGHDDIDRTLEEYPDFIGLLLDRAENFYQSQKYDQAERTFAQVLDLNAHIPAALAGIANIYFTFGLYEKALHYYEEALKASPLYYKGLFGKAVCLSQLQDYEASNRTLAIIIENQLEYQGESYYYRAFNNFLLENVSEVEPDIKKAEAYIPGSLELNTLAGMYYYHIKKLQKARYYFRLANQIDPKYAEPYYYLGLIDVRENKTESALKNLALSARYFKSLIDSKEIKIADIDKKEIKGSLKIKIRNLMIERLRRDIIEIVKKLETALKIFTQRESKEVDFITDAIKDLNSKNYGYR